MNCVAKLVQRTTNSLLLSQAQEHEANGNLVEAIDSMDKVVEQIEKPEGIYCSMSRLFLKLNQTEKAEAAAIQALQADPQSRKAYMLLGEILEVIGNKGEAAKCYTFILPERINKKYFEGNVSVINSKNSSSTKRYVAFPAENAITLHTPKHISFDSPANFSWPQIKADESHIDVLEQGKIWFDEFNIVVSDKDQNILGNHTVGNNSLIGSVMRQSKPYKHKGRVMALVARGSGIYYHWMIDILPGLAVLQASGVEISSIDKFIVHGPVNKWHLETLAHFGIRQEQILKARHHPYIEAGELIIPYFRNGMGRAIGSWVPDFLNREFGDKTNDNIQQGKRLYLTRAARGSRGIANEEELVAVLSKRGFESIACESLSRAEQATLMAQADVVLAPHGAALTNIIYCRPGTKIIELYGSHISPAYWAISRLCKLDYYSHFCYESEYSRRPDDYVLHAKTRVERMCKSYSVNADEISDLLDYAAVY